MDALTAEIVFRLLLERGIRTTKENAVALALLDRSLADPFLEPVRRRSLTAYRDAIESGRRVGVIVVPLSNGNGDDPDGGLPWRDIVAQIAACL